MQNHTCSFKNVHAVYHCMIICVKGHSPIRESTVQSALNPPHRHPFHHPQPVLAESLVMFSWRSVLQTWVRWRKKKVQIDAVKNTSASHDDRRATIYPAMSASGSQNARCPRALRPPIRLVVSHQAQARQHCNHTQLLQKRLSNYLLELQCLTGTRPVENVIPGSRRRSKEPLANGWHGCKMALLGRLM